MRLHIVCIDLYDPIFCVIYFVPVNRISRCKDPVLSPIYADLKGFPPTLCMTGTRDHCLSGTVDFHRALLRADVDARLMVFGAMKHAHWYAFDLPESKEAREAQARFLDKHLG